MTEPNPTPLPTGLTLPERIRWARGRRELTQGALADALGANRNTVGEWEAGRAEPSLAHARRLVEVLDVPFDWLVGKAAA